MNGAIILSATIIVLLVIIFILVVNKSNIESNEKIKKKYNYASELDKEELSGLVNYALQFCNQKELSEKLGCQQSLISNMKNKKIITKKFVNKHIHELVRIINTIDTNKNK